MTRETNSTEIASLTSIRGIAAGWVVTVHFSAVLLALLPEFSVLQPLFGAGIFAVPLFFILSGYVLGIRYSVQLGYPTFAGVFRFWILRLGRVYPVHFCTLVMSLVLVARHGWPDDEGHSLSTFIANCFLLQAWGHDFRLSWNYPSWSISSEWFAYLLFPAVVFSFRRAGPRWMVALTLLACVCSAAVYAFDKQVPFAGIAVVIPTFVGGVCLASLLPPGVRKPLAIPWSELGIVVAIGLPFVCEPGAIQSALYLVLCFVFVGSLGAAGDRCMAVWRFRPLVYLGEISYSLYMTHTISITLMARFLPLSTWQQQPMAFRIAVALSCTILIVGAAIGMYYAVERPCRRWIRRMGNPA